MIDLGTVRPGSTIYVPFPSYNSSGASVTITGLLASDIEIYKDGSTTQRASDNGYTLLDTDGIDFDGVTGVHGFSVSLADNSDAGFYAAGSRYWIVVSTVTIDSQTVTLIAGTFRIGYPSAVLDTTIATLSTQTSFTLTAGPAEDDALNGMWVVIHDVASAVQLGQAVISDYTGASKTVTLAAGTTFTVAATDNISVMGPAPLQPTVTGRTLDVTSTGAGGVDWGNVENKTTSNDLTGTTISTSQVVASVSGAVGSVTSRVTADVDRVDGVALDTHDAGSFPADVRLYGGTAGTFSGGRPEVNVSHISGDSGAADNAEAFFDGTGYAGTNNVIPTVTLVTTVTNLTNAPTAGDLTATMKTSVNTEVLDVLNVDTFAEPGQGTPPATTTIVGKIGYLYKMWRNRKTQTSTVWSLYNDDAVTVDQKATVADDGTTSSKTEIATGP